MNHLFLRVQKSRKSKPPKVRSGISRHILLSPNFVMVKLIWLRNRSRTVHTEPKETKRGIKCSESPRLGRKFPGNSTHFESIWSHATESKPSLETWPKGENFRAANSGCLQRSFSPWTGTYKSRIWWNIGLECWTNSTLPSTRLIINLFLGGWEWR